MQISADVQVFKDRTEAEDDLLEYIRMQELIVTVTELLEISRRDLISRE